MTGIEGKKDGSAVEVKSPGRKKDGKGNNQPLTHQDFDQRVQNLKAKLCGREAPLALYDSLARSSGYLNSGPAENTVTKLDSKNKIDGAAKDNIMLISRLLGVDEQIIFHLVEAGVIGKFPSSDRDWHLLAVSMPFLAKDADFLRQALRRLGEKAAQRILDTLDCEGAVERIIKETLLKNPKKPFDSVWENSSDGKSKLVTVGIDMILKYKAPALFSSRKDISYELPSEDDLIKESEKSAKVRDEWKNARAAYAKIKERLRKQAEYNESDEKGLSGINLEWQLHHLKEALRQSEAPEWVKDPIVEMLRMRRLSRIRSINEQIYNLGGISPVPYREYVASLIAKLNELESDRAKDYLKFIHDDEAVIRLGAKGWFSDLQQIELWIKENDLPF